MMGASLLQICPGVFVFLLVFLQCHNLMCTVIKLTDFCVLEDCFIVQKPLLKRHSHFYLVASWFSRYFNLVIPMCTWNYKKFSDAGNFCYNLYERDVKTIGFASQLTGILTHCSEFRQAYFISRLMFFLKEFAYLF